MARHKRVNALTAPEMILLHLEEFASAADEGEAPYALSQNGMADRTGLLRSHVPRALRRLLKLGLARERLSHVKSGGRSRNVYGITWEGTLAAREIRHRLEGWPVRVELPGADANRGVSAFMAFLEPRFECWKKFLGG